MRHQHDAHDRHSAGAADHLHGHHAADAARLEALAPEPPDKKNQPPPDQDRTVVIVIDKDKSMHINNEDTDMDKLGPRLEQIFKTRAERVVFVKGDPDLEYQTVARAIDVAKGAQMDKVGLMTPKLESGN
jgi:biopolymer transport protein TolR